MKKNILLLCLFTLLITLSANVFAEVAPAIYAKVDYHKSTGELFLKYNGRALIKVEVPPETKLKFREISDGCLLTTPLTQQIFLGTEDEQGCEANITFYLSSEGMCMRPRRAKEGEAILGQVGKPLIYGANGLYDSDYDFLLSWTDRNWQWTDDHILEQEHGIFTAKLKVQLSNVPWLILFKPRYYKEHLGWRYYDPGKRRPNVTPIAGWCSWMAYRTGIDIRAVTNTADFLAANFKPYGLEYLQIDDGFQEKEFGISEDKDLFSSWFGKTKKFPNGIEEAPKLINERGLRPGIWMSTDLRVFKPGTNDLDYVLREKDGALLRAPWIRNPINGRQETIDALFSPIWKKFIECGFQYLKVDSLRHNYYDGFGTAIEHGLMTTEEARKRFRNFFSSVRAAIGEKVFFLPCWGVFAEGIGYADAMRIGIDSNKYWERLFQQTYDLARYWPLQRILFQLDPDHVCVSTKSSWARMALSTVSLCGGVFMITDKTSDYTEDKISIIQECLPPIKTFPAETGTIDFSKPAFANIKWTPPYQDSADAESPGAFQNTNEGAPFGSLWAFHFQGKVGNWCQVQRNALWNLESIEIPLEKLGLDPDKEYLVFDYWAKDYWQGRFCGKVKGSIKLDSLEVGSSQTLSLRPDIGIPCYIGSTRHVSCGAVELLEEIFQGNTLELTLEKQPNDFLIYIYIPEGYLLDEMLVENAEAKNTKLNDDRVLRILIKPRDVSKILLKLRFKKYLL